MFRKKERGRENKWKKNNKESWLTLQIKLKETKGKIVFFYLVSKKIKKERK